MIIKEIIRVSRCNRCLHIYDFLLKLIAGLGEGQSVAVVQNDAQLTTVEAARMLGVLRQAFHDVVVLDT